MEYKTINEIKSEMLADEKNWQISFFDFVDDFRRTRKWSLIEKPLDLNNEKFDSFLASTIEYLCDEMGIETPNWTWEVPVCKEPWFVAGYENLKAITIAESPAFFRRRKIFVLENFLSRM